MRLAFLDFDGTLSRGYISMAFMDHLHGRGLYSRDEYARQQGFVRDVGAGTLSYAAWLPLWAESWAAGLRGRPLRLVEQEAESFYQGFQPNIHATTPALLRGLRDRGYIPIIVSAGDAIIIAVAARDIGAERCLATTLASVDGMLTGKVRSGMVQERAKEDAVRALAAQYHADLRDCAAFGDSAHDIPMLSLVGHPFALNPNADLERIASERGWPRLHAENALDALCMLPER